MSSPICNNPPRGEFFRQKTCTVPPVDPSNGGGYDVVPSLIDLLANAMAEAEDRHGVKRAQQAVADHLPVGVRQVRHYLREKDSSPPAGELDALVTAVAAEAGKHRLDFWRQALASVETAVETRGGDPWQEAAEAAALLPRSKHDPDEPQ